MCMSRNTTISSIDMNSITLLSNKQNKQYSILKVVSSIKDKDNKGFMRARTHIYHRFIYWWHHVPNGFFFYLYIKKKGKEQLSRRFHRKRSNSDCT